MQIGYARVSTKDQDLRLQCEALRQVTCDKTYEDKAGGAKASREGMKLALDVLRENDTLVVWKLDRLGRSVKDLVNIVSDLQQTRCTLQILDRSDRHFDPGRAVLFSCNGQLGTDGTGPDGGANQSWIGSGSPAGTYWEAKT